MYVMSLVTKIVAFTTNIIMSLFTTKTANSIQHTGFLYSIKSRLPQQLQACHGMLKDIVQLL